MNVEYEMEELVPIVGKLAEKYTAHESTSITYEKAEQFMGAVLYCIHEAEENSENSLISNEKISAQRAYEIGLAHVEEKTEGTLKIYNRMIPEFYHYENQCLYDTFVKGIPEFFKWYDIRFEPQNTIVGLDYPVLEDISKDTGIDQIDNYVKSICLEQKFLKVFPVDYVTEILSKNNRNWRESKDNICETVFTYVAGHILAGKPLVEFELGEMDYLCIEDLFARAALEDIEKRLETVLEAFIKNHCEGDRELFYYLSNVIHNAAVRLKYAAEHQVLDRMI